MTRTVISAGLVKIIPKKLVLESRNIGQQPNSFEILSNMNTRHLSCHQFNYCGFSVSRTALQYEQSYHNKMLHFKSHQTNDFGALRSSCTCRIFSYTFIFRQRRKIFTSAHLLSFLSILFILLTESISCGSALPALCADAEAVDLLALALSETGRSSTAVEIISDKDNIKGYRFDSSARLLGTNTKNLFPYCSRFPAEFSLVLTFQHNLRRPTNEFIMTTLGQDRRTILLSVRIRRDRLFFDYMAKTETVISTSIKSPALSDGQWHTVIITVSSDWVKFTVDCKTGLKSKLTVPFPKKMNIEQTRIYVGSRRIKRKRFTGLLRQLVLVPGSDASIIICPSNNPSLATLDKNSGKVFKQPVESPPYVTFEKDPAFCSIHSKGSLIYTEATMQLELCNGHSYGLVRGGPERMDYIVDYDDIVTNNFTLSVEHFTIPDEGDFVATANYDDMISNMSHIYLWNQTLSKFVHFQSIKTQSAMMWKFFQIGYQYFLAVANAGGVYVQHAVSVIYRWSYKEKKFIRHQILTIMARSVEVFSIDMIGSSCTIIFKWSPDQSSFLFYNTLPTCGVLDLTFFRASIAPNLDGHCLAIANALGDTSSRVASEIYCWEDSIAMFIHFQTIETIGASDWEYFNFEDRYFLAVANQVYQWSNERDDSPVIEHEFALNSVIYEFDISLLRFVFYQRVETNGATDWEFFTIGNQRFLALANSNSSISHIYRWRGVEKFVEVHRLPIGPTTDIDYIPINGEHYLATANHKGNRSKLLKIVTY
ncbi:thrombospondin-type laminin G domain and EAR repeat-containing protein-like isoform X2 [Clavelina lepadiformis]|uniref:thrombospondin-type laminin G domain and EAR repeat-containing protein-like isoform X2 n=1 Tax=Clavelina lepadiformis TaxID=159417 RepID=UPI0040420FE5